MYTLRMLGGIGLRDDQGHDVDALLRQPKHIALLAYLCLPRPGVWHRRDSVLGTFWAEHDQARARSALRSALYTIRRNLPEGAVKSRGDDELSVDVTMVETDVAALLSEVAAKRYEEALGRYTGEMLPGLYVADAPAFEKWLEQERARVRGMAREAAAQLADQLEKSGDLSGALNAAKRGAELDPDDEAATRKWIALLDKSGDRSQAFAVYERFRNHLSEAFGVRPSAETVALLDAVRTRREPSVLVVNSLSPVVSDSGATDETERAPISHSAAVNEQARVDEPSLPPKRPSTSVSVPTRTNRNVIQYWSTLFAAAALGAAVVGFVLRRPSSSPVQAAVAAEGTARILVVLPTINETDRTDLDYVGNGISDRVGHRLLGIGNLRLRSGVSTEWNDAKNHDAKDIFKSFGATILLYTRLSLQGDSLELRASVIDSATSEERSVGARKFVLNNLRDVESQLAADIAGAVFRVAIPKMPGNVDVVVKPESYRLTLQGWYQLLSTATANVPEPRLDRQGIAEDLFRQALLVDANNARAYSGLSSTWASKSQTDLIDFDEGYIQTESAARTALQLDSLQGSALANLGIMTALKERKLSAGMPLILKAAKVEPGNPEIFLILSALLRSAHRYDDARDAIRFARTLDPATAGYVEREAIVDFCEGRPEAARRLFKERLNSHPGERLSQDGLTRAEAMLGNYDAALASWLLAATTARDTALVAELRTAKGQEGYWAIRHRIGKARRARQMKDGVTSSLRLMQTSFASGDSAAGFAAMDAAVAEHTRALYRAGCMPDVDEFRATPRFKAMQQTVGALMP